MDNYINVIIAFAIALVAVAIGMKYFIPHMVNHQFKQYIRELGPESHQKKAGTPTMGGTVMILGIFAATLVVSLISGNLTANLIISMLALLLYGLIGFQDDYEKVIKKNNEGLLPKEKLSRQIACGFGIGFYCYMYLGGRLTEGQEVFEHATDIWIPIWDHYIELGVWYILFAVFVMLAFTNAVNLTDGLDGLASSVTALVAACMVFCLISRGFTDQPIIMASVCGACIGFLIYNHHPAKIFMGDTGSLSLGGVLGAAALISKMEFILLIAGLIYVIEALSVVLQVGYFKITHGKRIFRMAPIHHHFELGGMKEQNVVKMFATATLIFCALAILALNA